MRCATYSDLATKCDLFNMARPSRVDLPYSRASNPYNKRGRRTQGINMFDTTHKLDDKGVMRQIVTPEVLKKFLQEQGLPNDRPPIFGPDDEWKVA